MAKVGVIVSMLAGPGPSQCFAKVKGREVFMRSLELFVARDDVCATILAVAQDNSEEVKSKYGAHLAFASVKVVAGADHFAAVEAGLEKIPADAELIAIHDAACPAVSAMQIDELFKTAAKSGAAMLAAAISQTLRQVGPDKKLVKTVAAKDLWLGQSPQVFKAQILRDAYAKRSELGDDLADDADLVAAAGTAVTMLASSWRNIRIAGHDDLAIAAPIIDGIPKPKLKGPVGPYAEDKMW